MRFSVFACMSSDFFSAVSTSVIAITRYQHVIIGTDGKFFTAVLGGS